MGTELIGQCAAARERLGQESNRLMGTMAVRMLCLVRFRNRKEGSGMSWISEQGVILSEIIHSVLGSYGRGCSEVFAFATSSRMINEFWQVVKGKVIVPSEAFDPYYLL
ncbi:hypothetical protein NPIL_630561 [Nephila pilipes]|uniref:Uncharacterized protein n=1 Tax=Nephila pilipes TaxID=299642 RepID=A0A8X6QDY4_NEPPI|nr:hypothetical protein NPIL_630561 [Nephila pilipes]